MHRNSNNENSTVDDSLKENTFSGQKSDIDMTMDEVAGLTN